MRLPILAMQLAVVPPLYPAIDLALAHCKAGGVICYPTDTLYGLGGDATRPDVVERIMDIKGRGMQSPFSVIFADLGMAREYVELDDKTSRILSKHLPGPLTFMLPVRKKLPVTPGPLLGCRIPASEFCLALARKFGKPLITTSANRHGRPPAASAQELDEIILNRVDLLVDGGPCPAGVGSTIVDLAGMRIMRAGAADPAAHEMLKALGKA